MASPRLQHFHNNQADIRNKTSWAGALSALLGQNVRRRRVGQSIPIDAAAAAVGISLEDYQAREDGVQRFTPPELADLCELLQIMPSLLFQDRSSEP